MTITAVCCKKIDCIHYWGTVRDCTSRAYVKTAVPANWVGGFMGYNQGEIIGCAYDKSRNANWEAVDVILYDAPSDVVDIADEAVSE